MIIYNIFNNKQPCHQLPGKARNLEFPGRNPKLQRKRDVVYFSAERFGKICTNLRKVDGPAALRLSRSHIPKYANLIRDAIGISNSLVNFSCR